MVDWLHLGKFREGLLLVVNDTARRFSFLIIMIYITVFFHSVFIVVFRSGFVSTQQIVSCIHKISRGLFWIILCNIPFERMED